MEIEGMFFPDYFMDRAKKCLALAKKIRNPALAETFAERARILTRTAVDAERVFGLQDRMENLRPRTVLSTARTIVELRRDLQNLSAGMSLYLQTKDFVDLSPDAWKASGRLAEEFGCDSEIRPDGSIWFVKRS